MDLIIGVSILVFVELALDVASCSPLWGRDSLFQSLFSWNLLLMVASTSALSSSPLVSILVFVELALDEALSGFLGENILRFNPCFRGTCS